MPFIILSTAPALPPEFLSFPRQVMLERTASFASFPRYAELGRPTLLSFPRVVSLEPAGEMRRFPRQVLMVPVGSPLADMPLTPVPGATPAPLEVSCVLGKALKVSYEHTGEDETATVTLKAARASVPGNLTLAATVAGQIGFSTNLSVDPRQWEERTENGVKFTTIRLYNETAYRAQSKPLPELIPWQIAPRSEDTNGKGPPPREIGVSDVVRMAAAAAGLRFALQGSDVFASATWKEEKRDYSTEGKTFAGVFGDAYGAAGYRLTVRGNVLLGLAPGDSITPQAPTFTRCELQTVMRRGESGHVPGLMKLTAADLSAKNPKPPTDEKDPDAEDQDEQDKKQSWFSDSTEGDTRTITTGYVKGGLLRETQEVQIGQVVVTETVEPDKIDNYGGWQYEIQANYSQPTDGSAPTITNYSVTRTLEKVLLSDTRTLYSYHPKNPEALTGQVVTKRTYGYGLGTDVTPKNVPGALFSGFISAGDLLTDEPETVTQVWRESGPDAGTLESRRSDGRRLISTKQQNAEGDPLERGPLEAREYAPIVNLEEYRRIGNQWHRQWATVAGTGTAVYDEESGEAARLALRTGSVTRGSEIMQNEPPKVSWPTPEEETGGTDGAEEEVTDESSVPVRAQFSVEGGGYGVLTQDFPMLTTEAELVAVANLLARANGPRERQEITVTRPRATLPGDGGVEGVSLTIEDGKRSLTISTVQATAPRITRIPWPEEKGVSQGIVMGVNGQQVKVKRLKLVNGAGVWVESSAAAPKGRVPSVGSRVGVRLDDQGRNVITGG